MQSEKVIKIIRLTDKIRQLIDELKVQKEHKRWSKFRLCTCARMS